MRSVVACACLLPRACRWGPPVRNLIDIRLHAGTSADRDWRRCGTVCFARCRVLRSILACSLCCVLVVGDVLEFVAWLKQGCVASVFRARFSCVCTCCLVVRHCCLFRRHQRIALGAILVVAFSPRRGRPPPPLIRAAHGIDDIDLDVTALVAQRPARV